MDLQHSLPNLLNLFFSRVSAYSFYAFLFLAVPGLFCFYISGEYSRQCYFVAVVINLNKCAKDCSSIIESVIQTQSMHLKEF